MTTKHEDSRNLLVATCVDRADVFEAEIPLQVRLYKGSHKATAGSVHMNLHIISLQHRVMAPEV